MPKLAESINFPTPTKHLSNSSQRGGIMHNYFKGVRGDRVFRAATVSALILLTLFFVIIIVSLLTYTDWKTIGSSILNPDTLFAIKLSLATATITTILAVAIAIPVAYAISKNNFFGKSLVDSLLDLPIVISPIALGAALLVFFNTPLGSAINNNVLRFVFSVPGIVLAQFTVVSALAVRLLKSTFDGIDVRYEQVARTLGYSKLEAFFRVVLPLARNGLVASSILTWARAVGEFGATVTLAGATAMKTETLPISIFLNLSSANVKQAIALILILVVISLSALIVIRLITGHRYSI
jgi:molybdate transport system permease protein